MFSRVSLVLAYMAALLCSLSVQGAVIYDSISSVNFFRGRPNPASVIGDLLTLAGTERLLAQATVAYFKSTAGDGTGTLTLRFSDAGAPFGSLLGSYSQDFSTPGSGAGTVTIPNLKLLLPNTVGVAASIFSSAFINVLVHGPSIAVGSSADSSIDLGALISCPFTGKRLRLPPEFRNRLRLC